MKKLAKVILPSVLFLAFVISTMLVVASCVEEGDQCSKCTSDSDCNYGLKCFMFTNGTHKCAENAGDVCF